MAKTNDNRDDFWDLSELEPKKKYITHPTFDTSSVTVDTKSIENPRGIPIPNPKERENNVPRPCFSYAPKNSLIKSVTVCGWPARFSFYSKFHSEAVEYFNIIGKECPEEKFFAYTPQYEQLSRNQSDYYFYFRELVRGGEYPKADSSYIFLLLYEIINIPELLKPEKGAELIANIWEAYRGTYPYLDRYIGEWLCDYCLIHRLGIPKKVLSFSGDITGNVSLPEFYENPLSGSFPFESILKFSSCDYKKSRFYPENKNKYDLHIPTAAVLAVKSFFENGTPNGFLMESHEIRDSFQGAVAYVGVKYKINITCLSLRKSREYHQLCSAVIKACENELRAALGIKSRYSVKALPEICKKAICEYFDRFYPLRRAKKRAPTPEEEAPYMRFYAPRHVGEADIARALRIEENAWQTAKLLEPENDNTDIAPAQDARPSPDGEAARRLIQEECCAAGGELCSALLSIDEKYRFITAAALENNFKERCAKYYVMPDEAARIINEAAYDFTGDILIDEDFCILEDYISDTENALKAIGISLSEE